jgi:hypothetical protein
MSSGNVVCTPFHWVGRLFPSIVSAAIQTNNDKIKKKDRPAVIQKTEIITEANQVRVRVEKPEKHIGGNDKRGRRGNVKR